MRIGLMTPGVSRPRGQANDWEATCTVADLSAIAGAADSLGIHHLTCSDHVAVPEQAAKDRGGTYWDPAATLAYLAAHTSRIKLATHVLVIGYRHPLQVIKQFGTLDRLSGGRLILGLGVGSLREEFDLLGAEFADRGDVASETVRAIRKGWGDGVAEFHGKYFDYSGLIMDPTPVQQRIPIWFGGRTRRSLRRAVESGDGWVPFGLELSAVHRMLAGFDLPTGFDVALAGERLDPINRREEVLDHIGRMEEAGATLVNASMHSSGPDEFIEQMTSLVEAVGGSSTGEA